MNEVTYGWLFSCPLFDTPLPTCDTKMYFKYGGNYMIKYILGLMASFTVFANVATLYAAPIHDAAYRGDLKKIQ